MVSQRTRDQERMSTMKTDSFRQTTASISLSAIEQNARAFHSHLSPGSSLMAVVKANGYGHGAVEAAEAALRGGAESLGVAILDEAVALRKAGITVPILVMGHTAPEAMQTAADHDIALTVFATDARDEALRIAASGQQIRVHLKIETGMGRIGITTKEQLLDIAAPLFKAEHVALDGMFTHFAEADTPSSPYTDEQFARFQAMAAALDEAGISIPVKHCCNSAGTMLHPDKHLDMVRVGISLYGLRPDPEMPLAFPLEQAMTLSSQIVSIRRLDAGHTISYGRTHTLTEPRDIATLPIGYADGLPRLASNQATVTVNGQEAPLVGRVCMDQTMIDVTGLNVRVYDHVTFSIDQLAERTGTINYEIVCGVSPRVPRVYE
ncbi:alanine racemase [Bacillus daqingensis]|uniref:Alanine racemase n=1 Tax=Bacillus daqingensis TaxID=872396 RepID=A0ABV9NS64_9BACI